MTWQGSIRNQVAAEFRAAQHSRGAPTPDRRERQDEPGARTASSALRVAEALGDGADVAASDPAEDALEGGWAVDVVVLEGRRRRRPGPRDGVWLRRSGGGST